MHGGRALPGRGGSKRGDKQAGTPATRSSAQASGKAHRSHTSLHYVRDDCSGISRRKLRGRFAYFLPDGTRLKDAEQVRRIDALAIPPAYSDVWICPDPCGHLQATGRDARGRKQYRYHAAWREIRDANKYDRMLAFSEALPVIRRQVEKDLALPGVPRQRVLATLVRLLETTLIRVGNEAYAKDNDSYGLTTLQDKHVDILGSQLSFRFRGKSGVEHDVSVRNARLAKIVRRCADIPGHELFQYLDEAGMPHKLGSSDVNDYLHALSSLVCANASFTAKDFRTWAGSALAFELLRPLPAADDEAIRRKNVVSIVESVAACLGNTPAVCRRAYIHPAILQRYLEGASVPLPAAKAVAGLSAGEARLKAFLAALPSDARR
ncbi:DNA topoisomerase IB [Uliginosibacterium sp. H3]|uniref:DNA topoisomerase n=1 Tax=Uliginosibacterium silvisoli TaxID=3114758 RepID=A0ABU6K9D4_9RHOO|nr:DNA topoisomerase IB [Uliginosibacterium sp. H3]